MTKVTLAGAAAIFLLTSGCGEEELVGASGETEQEIIGGFRATGRALNAVGTVGMKTFDGRYSYFCSATLIAPKLVLTAKHCAMVLSGPFAGMKLVNVTPIHFAIGANAAAPVRIVEAIAADLSPLHEGGTLALGSDVAIYHLAEAIIDVTPLPLAPAPLAGTDLGKRYLGIGYGAKDIIEDTLGVGEAQRRAGYMTLRALTGSPAQTIWPTFQDLVDAVKTMVGETSIEILLPELRKIYAAQLFEGYEAWVGLSSHQSGHDGSSDAQSCHGDSGGPLVGVGADKGIYGVVSGGYFSRDLTCDHGTFFATLGPRVRDMITAGLSYNDPCAGVSTQGSCHDTIATRCTDKFEGDRRLAQVDCADLGMACGRGLDGVVACLDETEEPSMAPTPPRPPRPVPPTLSEVRAQVSAITSGRARLPASP